MSRENPFVAIYKSCNNGSNEEKYQLITDGQISLPRYIDIELTNNCNFRCCFCPTGTKSMRRTKGFMPDDVVDAIVENVRRFQIPGVRLIRWGEPTLHEKYIEIIKKLKDAGTLVHINTNGSLLDHEQIVDMVNSGLDSIKFSFQGADEGTYNEMREGGDYKRLLDTVRTFHSVRGGGDKPYIQISTTLTAETADQIESFKADIGDYCDYYNVGYTKLNHLNVEAMNVSEEEKAKIRDLQQQEKLNHVYTEVCPEAFDKLSINWNGDVTLCCTDYDNFMVIGNILDSDLQELFTSRAADQYRQIVVKKEYGRVQCCKSCYNFYRQPPK